MVNSASPVSPPDFLARYIVHQYFPPREREPMWSMETICRFFARRLRYSYESVMMMEESSRNIIFGEEYKEYLDEVAEAEKLKKKS